MSTVATETFASTNETTNIAVVPRVITQAIQIARYFTEDLTEFIRQTHIDLLNELHIRGEPGYPQDVEEVIGMLYDDFAHLIRDGLINAINLLISEKSSDPNQPGVHLLRYHATYLIAEPVRSLKAEGAKRIGGFLAPPPKVWRDGNFRFALLIDWNPSANYERRRRAVRPAYCFDWVPETARFDASSLIRYRSGGLTMDGATIVSREEAAAPGYQGI